MNLIWDCLKGLGLGILVILCVALILGFYAGVFYLIYLLFLGMWAHPFVTVIVFALMLLVVAVDDAKNSTVETKMTGHPGPPIYADSRDNCNPNTGGPAE
jgi:hypothetical protein